MKRACVVGAGNSAHATAGLIASLPDWECHVYAPFMNEADLWNEGLKKGSMKVQYGPDDNNLLVHGVPKKISKDAADVVPGCSVLIFCLPALAYEVHIKGVAPYVDKDAMIGTICASSGFDWCIDEAMAKVGRGPDSYGVFAYQNLPWACRINEFGVEVAVLGAKPFMEMVVRPVSRSKEICEIMEKLIRMKTPYVEGGFIGAGLSNVCQIIHPVVMYDNFKDWDGKKIFKEKPLFYQGLSDDAADIMAKVSEEIALIKVHLEKNCKMDLGIVRHIFEWCMRAYGKYIVDDSTLRKRFSTNKAYAGLVCPMKAKDGGWVPDYAARYISEDIPFNLCSTKGMAELCGIDTPTIDLLINWCQKVMGKEYIVSNKIGGKNMGETFAPQRFGFKKIDDIPAFKKCCCCCDKK